MKKTERLNLMKLVAIGLTLSICFVGWSHKKNSKIAPVIKTSRGDISGLFKDDIYSFTGIPYAKAERFMAPQEADRWDGVRECTKFGPIAMQVNSWSPDSVMDEKNLFTVNVWTQGLNDDKKRPVMFWLHGGGFGTGSSDDPITDGQQLAKKGDVVVVSVNHRLNILGFLDLSAFGPQYANSANAGMLDVVEALKWVNKNIKNFGGDPGNVTIFGESGGGGKVGTLMCMPAAKGLFHKAIIQSGTLINVMTKVKSREIGVAVTKVLGVPENELSKLETIPYRELVKAGDSALVSIVGRRRPGSSKFTGFGPVPDGVHILQQPFTPGFADISNHVPLLIGTTFNELMRTTYSEKDLTLDEVRERLKKSYGVKTDKFIELFSKAYPDFTPHDLLSIDTVFRPYTIMVADAKASLNRAPVYAYFLAWKSPVNNGSGGSFHGLDIPLAFNNIILGKHWTGTSSEAYKIADEMSSAWINFAKTGKPGVNHSDWPAYTKKDGTTMLFDTKTKIVRNHDQELMNLIKPIN